MLYCTDAEDWKFLFPVEIPTFPILCMAQQKQGSSHEVFQLGKQMCLFWSLFGFSILQLL